MKKVVIIGSGGAGKSTFARRLHEVTGIPLIHLDKVFWQPNWTEMPKGEWQRVVENLLKDDEWIMDGNFGGTMELRLKACDTIVYLDLPRTVCVYHALKRVIFYYNRNRPDMGAGCNEKFDLKFLGWIWRFPAETKPEIEERLKNFGAGKKLLRFGSRREIENFFVGLTRDKVKSE